MDAGVANWSSQELKDKSLAQFVTKTKKEHKDAQLYLFGSRAGSKAREDSDYDVIIISKEFEGIPFVRRSERAFSLWDAPEMLDVLCYTPHEYKRFKSVPGILKSATKRMKLIG